MGAQTIIEPSSVFSSKMPPRHGGGTRIRPIGVEQTSNIHAKTRRDDQLWEAFWTTADPKAREELIVQNLHLVNIVIHRLPSDLFRHWSIDDLRSFGTIGLINAVDRRRSDLAHIPFAPYAIFRIKGAIFDEFRSLDWLPRSQRRKVIDYRTTEDALRSSMNRLPTHKEIFTEMKISDHRQVSATLSAVHRSQLISLQDRVGTNDESTLSDRLASADDPESAVIARCSRDDLRHMITKLPASQQKVVSYRFFDGLTQRRVGELLGVSGTRIAQLERRALRELRHLLHVSETAVLSGIGPSQ